MNSKIGRLSFVTLLAVAVILFYSTNNIIEAGKKNTSSGSGWNSWNNDDDSSGGKGHGKSHDDDSSSGHKPKKKKPKREWLTKGNANIDSEKHFLGTTDEADLVIKTNNTEKARITIDGDVGIGTASPTGTLHVNGGTADADTDGKDITIEAQDGGPTTGLGGNIVLTPGTDGDGASSGTVFVGEVGGIDTEKLILDINGQISIRGGTPFLGAVLTSDSFGNATWQSVDDADADPTNELNTALSLSGTVLSISDAGGAKFADLADLIDDADANPTNELQTLTQTGNSVTLSNGGGSVSVDDGDSDSTNELNTGISFDGTSLTVTDSGGSQSVDISDLEDDADADPTNELNTNVTLTGSTLEITDEGGTKSADLSSLSDTDWEEGSGNVFRSTGNVGIGTPSPLTKLQVIQDSEVAASVGGTGTFDVGLQFINWGRKHAGIRYSGDQLIVEDASATHAPSTWFSVGQTPLDFIVRNGRLGVGTSNPGATLDVAGNIAVSGTVDSVDISGHAGNASAHHTRFANSEETDPTVLPSVKDGIVWGEVGGIPADIANGDQVDDADADPANELNTAASLTGTDLKITDAGGDQTVDLSSLVDDADADITNELNTSVVLNGTNLEVTDAGGTIVTDLSSLDDSEVDPEVGVNTTNFMPKWDGSALVTGTVFDNGTNVGIGTNSPFAKLHVTSPNSGDVSAKFLSGDTSNNTAKTGSIDILAGAVNFWANARLTAGHEVDGSVADSFLALSTRDAGGTTEKMRVTSGGSVGIGTTNPDSKLTLQSLADGSLISVHTSHPSNSKIFEVEQFGVDGFLSLRTGSGTTITKLSGYGGTPSFFLSNVGVGTASPVARLDIVGNIKITDGTQGVDRVLTSDVNGLASWQPIANDGDWTISGNDMYSAVTGNVGIGINAPSTNLDIVENNTDTLGALRIRQNGAGDASMFFANGPEVWAMGLDNSDGDKFKISSDNSQANVGAETRLTIDHLGRVGIGTTSPNSKLHIGGSIAGGLRNWMDNGLIVGKNGESDGGYFGLKDEGFNRQDTVIAWGDDFQDHLRFIFSRSGGPTNGEEVMRIVGFDNFGNGGNVGIGTTNPGAKLEVAGKVKITGGVPGLGKVLTSDASGLASWEDVVSGDPSYGSSASSPNEAVFVNNSGNVGIGTTSPIASLDVAGEVALTSDNARLRLMRTTGTNFIDYEDSYAFGIRSMNIDNTNIVDRLTIDTLGRLGFGTTNTGNAKFTISGTDTTLFRLENEDQTKESSMRFRTKTLNGSTNFHADIALKSTSNSGEIGYLGFKVPFNNTAGAGYDMVINSDGNVGIGTTTPTALLQVESNGVDELMLIGENNGSRRVPKLHFRDDNGGWDAYIRMDTDHSLKFDTESASGAMRVDTNGNVSVGNTLGGKLSIAAINNCVRIGGALNGSEATGLQFYDQGTQHASLRWRNGSGTLVLEDSSNGASPTNWYSGQRVDFQLRNGRGISTHGWTTSSDRRYKKNISKLDNSLDKLMRLRGVRYDLKEDSSVNSGHGKHLGVIAQEIESEYPELVVTDEKTGYKAVAYDKLTAVLIEAVKELKAENDELKNKFTALADKHEAIVDMLLASSADLPKEKLVSLIGEEEK